MLTQAQCVSIVMGRNGQFILSPEDVDFTPDYVSKNFFIPAVREYQKYRPILRRMDVTIVGSNYNLPEDFLRAVSLEPRVLYQGVVMPFLKMPTYRWEINEDTRTMQAPGGTFIFEYLAKFTVKSEIPGESVSGPAESKVAVALQEVPQLASIVFSCGTETATVDGEGVITGSFVDEGLVTAQGIGEITLAAPTTLPLTATYNTVVPYCLELDLMDRLFLDLFEVTFLKGFASAKQQLQLEGVPVQINLEELMAYLRGKETEFYSTTLGTQQKWWAFGGA